MDSYHATVRSVRFSGGGGGVFANKLVMYHTIFILCFYFFFVFFSFSVFFHFLFIEYFVHDFIINIYVYVFPEQYNAPEALGDPDFTLYPTG